MLLSFAVPRLTTKLEAVLEDTFERICSRLSERKATLFLGAGINAGIVASNGTPFPLGTDLASFICSDLLQDRELVLTLDEAAEHARYKVGESEFNRYLYKFFQQFSPGKAHLSIVRLPWDAIYTTNYDLLLENASERHPSLMGELSVVTSIEQDLKAVPEEATIYYKLHGSVDKANTDDGRLVLTKEDYRTYTRLRQPLFRRLRDDLQSRTFVFVGYSLGDPDFREVLEDCRSALDVDVLPLSFAVRPKHRPAEADYWKDKYNIRLIDSLGEDFLEELAESWTANMYSITPLEERRKRDSFVVDDLTSFPTHAHCYYRLIPTRCSGMSDPAQFFKGAEATWADVRDGIPPERDAMWDVMEVLFEEFTDTASPASAYLVHGHAGTGKTTLLRTIAFAAARDFDVPVFVHIAGTPLQSRHLSQVADLNPGKRILLIVHHAAEVYGELAILHNEARRQRLPLTVIVEERTNQWYAAANRNHLDFSPGAFELGPLTSTEIEAILDALTTHSCLGVLTNTDRPTQIEHFTAVAHKELLVALRELTTGTRFDDIVADEYNQIPSVLGRTAYKYVAAVGQIDLFIRYNTLSRLLECDVQDLVASVFQETEGVLLSSEFVGRSRYTIGYKVRVRHPIIASIVFAEAAPTDQSKYEVLASIIAELDPGYPEDRSLLNEIVRRRDLVRTFSQADFQRAIYDRLNEALPSNSYVAQHRSILERELDNGTEAVRFARDAVRLSPHNLAHRNTLGMALEFAARSEPAAGRRRALIEEAKKLFNDGLGAARSDPFAYLGLSYIKRQEYLAESNPGKRQSLLIEAISLLEQGREVTERPDVLEREYARLKDELGERREAIEALGQALKRDPANGRVRDLYVTYLTDEGRIDDALKAARTGIKHAPTSWRLFRHAARLLFRSGASTEIIREQFEAAIRNNRRNPDLLVELGSVLFVRGEQEEAIRVFRRGYDVCSTAQEKQMVRAWWRDESGEKRLFSGEVSRIHGGGAFVQAVPENFKAFFWRQYGINADLREGDKVQFLVGFNAFGARAQIARWDKTRQ